MGKGARKYRKAEAMPRRTSDGVTQIETRPVVDPPVDLELLLLRDLLGESRRLSAAGRGYLAARLQEDVDRF